MSQDRNRHVLARLTNQQDLARVVPQLPPVELHALIVHRGLHDSAELVALATPEQLAAVFDIDLWKPARPGADEQFDARRFYEWLEVFLDADASLAAQRLAQMDRSLLVEGLSGAIRVLDLAVFAPGGELDGATPVSIAGRTSELNVEIDGYLVVAREPEVWDTIVEALFALAEHDHDTFHRVMGACRTLSNRGWELDGLNDLLSDPGQLQFDLSVSREERRHRLGFVAPVQARAFLNACRGPLLTPGGPSSDPIADTQQLALRDESPTPHDYTEQFASLANVLVAGCSVQGRGFTHREAIDAVTATCKLAVACWPAGWPQPPQHRLDVVFRVGWFVLHRDVLMRTAAGLVEALDGLHCRDRDIQFDLQVLTRELRKHLPTGEPWRARDRLDVLASLDPAAWAALAALIDECPVMLANVNVQGGRSPHAVNPSEFQFVSDRAHLAAIHRFVESVPALLVS